MNSHKTKSFIQLSITILSILIGSLVIAPKLKIESKLGVLIGGLLGLILISIIFPSSKEGYFSKNDTQKRQQFSEALSDGIHRSWTHPTNLPITLSLIYFALLIIIVFALDKLNITIPSNIYLALFVMPLLWGISGFLMLIRNEYIDKFGRKHKGFWAILNGIIFITFGWGLIIYIALATIFNW